MCERELCSRQRQTATDHDDWVKRVPAKWRHPWLQTWKLPPLGIPPPSGGGGCQTLSRRSTVALQAVDTRRHSEKPTVRDSRALWRARPRRGDATHRPPGLLVSARQRRRGHPRPGRAGGGVSRRLARPHGARPLALLRAQRPRRRHIRRQGGDRRAVPRGRPPALARPTVENDDTESLGTSRSWSRRPRRSRCR